MRLTGDVVALHPTPADGPAIEAMYARCSFESRYARFLAPLAAIPGRHLAQVLVPGPTDEAWVAVRRDDPGTHWEVGRETGPTPSSRSSSKIRGSDAGSAARSSGSSASGHRAPAWTG